MENRFQTSTFIKVEPYWNVNDRITFPCRKLSAIKVEPYWNVNAKGYYDGLKQGKLKQNHIGM